MWTLLSAPASVLCTALHNPYRFFYLLRRTYTSVIESEGNVACYSLLHSVFFPPLFGFLPSSIPPYTTIFSVYVNTIFK